MCVYIIHTIMYFVNVSGSVVLKKVQVCFRVEQSEVNLHCLPYRDQTTIIPECYLEKVIYSGKMQNQPLKTLPECLSVCILGSFIKVLKIILNFRHIACHNDFKIKLPFYLSAYIYERCF